ncbi:hypothetical protein FRC03_006462 [Tulasnella sp. 419]|nr:hypothetical protein FRC03_006462 [Tulasnella sp. 419]
MSADCGLYASKYNDGGTNYPGQEQGSATHLSRSIAPSTTLQHANHKTLTSCAALTNHLNSCSKALKARETKNKLARHKLADKLKTRLDITAKLKTLGTKSQVFSQAGLSKTSITVFYADDRMDTSSNDPLHYDDLNQQLPNDNPLIPSPSVDSIPDPPSSSRTRRLPKKFSDFLPTGISRIVRQINDQAQLQLRPVSPPPPAPQPLQVRRVRLLLPLWKTALNHFRIFREYAKEPSFIPDEDISPHKLLLPSAHPEVSTLQGTKSKDQIATELKGAVAPFPNITSFWYRKHFSDSTITSKACMDRLQHIIMHERFNKVDLGVFNREKVDRLLISDTSCSILPDSKGWIQRSVEIEVPLGKDGEAGSETFKVEGLYYRKLTDVVRSSLQNESTLRHFHLQPFKQFWQPHSTDTTIQERVYDEFYTSDEMLDEYNKLQ